VHVTIRKYAGCGDLKEVNRVWPDQDDQSVTPAGGRNWVMQQTAKLVLTLLAGFALGAGAIQALQAQGVKKPAYVIAEVEVTDAPAYQAYAAKASDTLKPYHARFLVRGKPESKEGAAPQGNIVMVAFDSLADAERWYSTPPYNELIPERQKAAKTLLYIVEGLPQ